LDPFGFILIDFDDAIAVYSSQIVICLVLGLTEGLCKHDRRSKIIYDPRQLMEEVIA